MKVLVNKYSYVVEYIGTKADIVSNGIDVGEFIFGQAPDRPTVDILDLTIPDGIIAKKYCYTTEKGFYLNPAYVAPVNQEDFDVLKASFKNLQNAFAAQLGV
jgi:hypothetical protein